MYLTVKQQLRRLSKEEYQILRELCRTAKNLTNEAVYEIRQHYFETKQYLNYFENYHRMKDSENYKLLNSNMAQQILRKVAGSFQSFFGLLKLAKQGKYDFSKIKLPGYLPKDGYASLIVEQIQLKENCFVLPYSNEYKKNHESIVIRIPPILLDKKIKEIRIVPRADARFFEIQYMYEAECIERNLNKNNALALDLGVNNLATCVTSNGSSFILDGRRLKSINQWYNKEMARLQSIKDKQQYNVHKQTRRQTELTLKRNNLVNDYMSKAARLTIQYCIENDIGVLVVGSNADFQRKTNLGKTNNQSFVNIPYGKLQDKLEYLCELNGIVFVRQEESYTSKASFWDQDEIPVFGEEKDADYIFSGRRVKRGLYETANGVKLNADVNAALNILRKSNVVSLTALYSRGTVDCPARIRIA